MLPKNNNTRAWSAVACALLVLGLGLLAFATVGGAVDEAPIVGDGKARQVPAIHGISAQCSGVMVANGAMYPASDPFASGLSVAEWRWDDPASQWRP